MRKNSPSGKNGDFSLGHIGLKCLGNFTTYPGGYVRMVAGYVSLRLRGEDGAGDIM